MREPSENRTIHLGKNKYDTYDVTNDFFHQQPSFCEIMRTDNEWLQ